MRKKSRKLHLEQLEDRRVMAGAILSTVFADGSVVPINSVLGEAPRDMRLRFSDQDGLDAATLATGVRILRSGFDSTFGDSNDVVIQPGLLQLADNPREVIIRFADNLPDDLYRIQLIGAGLTPLRNLDGERFNNGVNQNFNFELDLGPQVISVVPQPITRNPVTGALTQAKNQVVVYFNQDKLDPSAAQNPAFYQLTDTATGQLLLPRTAQYSAAENRVLLTFANDLGDASFHLKIGVSEEQNGTLGTAVNIGTIVQRAEFKTYDSPVLLDAQGNPVTLPIPDNGTVISRITVGDAFLVRDVNVELNIDHEWGPDLRVFLIGPQGERVELVRDLGVDARQGQIYGTKFNDLDGDGVRDVGEAGLAGWTIFLDDNRNAVLDPGERSTVSDANGDYAFIGLELGRTYFVAEVGQPLWRQTTPAAGAERDLFQADFSSGTQQTLRVIPDPVTGDPTSGTFTLGFAGRATAPITYAGANAATAASIQQALQAIVDPGVAVAAQFLGTNPIRFQLTFTRNGLGTPVDHAPIVVQANALNRGSLAVDTVGVADGFTSTGPANQWHLSTGRGSDPGHSGQQSFYFGANETPTGGGTYQDNANGTLISPTVDLTDQRLTGPLSLEFNHRLNTEASFDFARVEVVTASGQRTTILNTDSDTSGFEAVALDISQFAGQQVHFEFTFVSDGSVVFEGWFVDDIRVTEQRGEHSVTLSTLPQAASAKDVDFGATLGNVFGPDQFGYTAFVVTPDFEDITATGQRTLQEFQSTGFAKQAGGPVSDQGNSLARDASGNVYVTGSFQGTASFGPGLTPPSLTSLGVGDVFLAKYDASGNLLWVRGIGGTGNDSGNDVQVDSAGNVLITGSFNATVDFDPSAADSNLISAGGSDAFVAKYDLNGNFIWAGQLGGTGVDVGDGLAIAAGNDVVVTGSFSGTTADMNPGAAVFNLTNAGASTTSDIFVTRLTSGGNFSWANRYGGTGNDIGRAVAVDLLGNISVTGSFSGTVDFNPAPDPAGPALVSAGSTDGFVLQLTGGGGFRWNQRFGGTQADVGTGVAVDSANAVILAGVADNNARVAKYTGLTGVQQWEQVFGGGSTDQAEDVAVDALDRIYLTGGFRTSFSLGGTTLTSAGGQDVFVARFTPAGGFDLARGMGGTQDDIGSGIAVDGNGEAYYVGSFRTTATFDTGPGSASLTSAGSTDAFLAKLAIVRGLDDATVHLTDADLGNFLFQFYGQNYVDLFVSTNGLITFGSANASPNNTDLENPPPQAAIAPFWENLVTGAGNTEAVFWQVLGSGADERLVIQWNNVQLAGSLGLGQSPLNFQAVLRERDNSIQFNYQSVTGPILVTTLADKTIGTFVKGQQNQPSIASDAAGNYVIVWNSPGQDGANNGNLFARRYNAAGAPLGAEFPVEVVDAANDTLPKIDMAPDGRFVVVWDRDGQDIMARLFDAAGNPVAPEFLVSATAGNQATPDVFMDAAGNFVVTWSGEGAGDANGIYARRFDSAGNPQGTVDEIQRLQILGPPAAPGPDTFTLNFGGQPTGNIAFAGVNNSLITAANIQTALRNLSNLSNSVTVTAVQQSEVQTITFNPDPTGGTFTLTLGAATTAAIDFTVNTTAAARATAIQNELNAIPNTNVSVVGLSSNSFTVTFQGVSGNQNQPALAIGTNGLLPANAVSLSNVETVRGINLTEQIFDVRFLGPDGALDQPLLIHADRLSGVTHLAIAERVKGNNGEFLVNSFLPGLQAVPSIAANPAGGFVINWTSDGQDGSLSGAFAKRFDANGNPLPGDADEIQEIELVGPPAAGSRYRLDFNGQITLDILHTGGNVTDAAAIQTALRNLGNLGNTLTVLPAAGTSNEVQRITFTNTTTGGTFQLAHSGLNTAAITFAGIGAANGVTTAGNIQAALNALPNLVAGVTVVPATVGDDRDFLVTFGGANGNINQPLLFLVQNNLTPAGAAVTLTELNHGALSTNRFIVEFNGVDGRTDQPNLLLNDNTRGVIAMNTLEIQKGANSEFIIPDTTLGSQIQPTLAWNPAGNFLAAWASPDGDGNGVFARLFDATGSPLGSEFQVNTFTQAAQGQPQAILDAAGNFVIVWTSAGQDGSGNGVYARLFTSDGTALGDEFLVTQETIADQSQPTIALTPTGFVVAWTTQSGAGGIHARRFLANGTPLDVLELQVSQFGTPSQNQPVVARNATGDYVVVWREDLRDPLVDQGIFFQKFFAGGGQTAEIRANVTTSGNQQLPDVAIDAAGNFVIVWQTFIDELAPLADHFDVVARRFDTNGVALSGELALSTTVANNQTSVRVAFNGSGGFIATWQSLNQDGSNREIFARRFDAANNPLDAQEFLVNTTTALSQSRPAIDALASGEFIIVWDSLDVNFGLDVFAQRFGANGQRIGTEFRVNTADVLGDTHRRADVAFDAAGQFFVAWQDNNNQISARKFDANAQPLTGDVVVSSGTSQSGPRISTTPDGRSTVVWTANNDIIAQRLTADLELIGPNLTINAVTAGTQAQATVSMGPNGEFLVGWLDGGAGSARVVVNEHSTENPSVGIKDAGTQAPFANLLPIWTNGANTPFVGSGLSTWIVKPQQDRQRAFAVDASAGLIRELNPDTGAVIRSIPAPGGASASGAGLAFVGNTLYYVSASGTSIFELDPSDGAIVDQLTLSSLGIVGQVGGLAHLNGQLIAQVPSTGTLYFIDTFKDNQVRSLATGLPFFGGLAGGGARGSLFGVRTSGQIIEIDPATATVVNTFPSPLAQPTGVAVIEGRVWVGDATGAVRVLNADTGAVLSSFATAIPLSALGGDDNGGIETAETSIFQPLTGTILDDEATTPITAGIGPYTGRFIPIEPLDVFDGAPVTGLWTLEVQDTAPNHVGELVNWKLIVNQPDQTPADFQTRAYLGDDIAQGANDIDIYRFNVLEAGSLTIDLAPFITLDGVVRVFNASGVPLGSANAIGAGVAEHLVVNLPAGGTYYIGISSNANVAYNPVTGANATGGTSTGDYQLEVRFDQQVLLSDDNSTYTDATNFGQLGEGGHFAWTAVSGGSPFLNMPGAGDEPGHRDIPIEAHLGAGSGSGSIPTQFYNFQDFYGALPSGDIPSNVITANQKQRAREIFEIYSSLLGIQFIETSNQGLTVVTGDMRAIDPTVPTGPGGVAGIAGGGRVIMDAAENWGSSEYGAGWFRVAMHEIGHSLGMGHTYDLPSLTIMGDQNSVDSMRFPDRGEPVFPGDAEIVHGQFLFPPGANDTDLYRFELTAPGLVSAEVIAERQNGSSLLDANLTLYREYVTLQGVTKREVIAGNDDYFSSDPRIELRLAPGVYYVAVTSSGNKEFDPAVEDSGFGGRSEGTYELHLDFQGNPRSTLNDLTQKPLDGDADGKAGGKFDFWFQSGDTIFVDKLRDVTSGTDGNGSIAQPYDNIAAALNEAGKRLVIPTAGGAAFADGETFILVDNLDKVATFEFDLDGNTLSGNIPVLFAATDNQAAMASSIVAAINTATGLTATASVSGGKIVKLAGIVRLDMAGSETLRATPNIVRIVGNGGTDGNVNTLLDNRPYLVGFNNAGQPLVDGSTFRVPQASTVMIDAGALLKIQGAIIDVGSSAQGIDRREGALQVLGTPRESVYFRSFRDDTAGGNSDGGSDGVHPGDWGGLVLRNDSDREGAGLFLNWINHANLEAGGGKVTVGSVEETFTPIHLVSSRPGISHNSIRLSADAAISADPDSFDDSQGRIGPDIHDNLVTNNSINGLFVRIRTLLGNPVDRLNVPGRFDDTDIVHVLSENLFITGTPGGPLLDNVIGELLPRIDARLAIDPGIILKIDGARIETQIGGQLIAEGTAAHPIIFTTTKDDRYGASGTFDSSNDGSDTLPTAGQWGGLFFGPFAKGSVDHALITFAGGSTPIEGGFDLFSAMEIHQADVRLTNSTFQDNASGQSTGNRSGRGDNDGSVVFVRGAQPVIVDNVFKDNLGAAISINANAMQALYRPDPGRKTGLAERFAQFDDNLGPLVRLNRLGNNATNGMVVRGADLTTETAWDDTDIVHVLFNEIEVLNHHTFSGLRLLSGAGESLVVKMEGASAGLTADGVPLDIDDRIGGTVQVIGQPGYPVVLTSFRDCSVGAGYTPEGLPQADTDNDGNCGGVVSTPYTDVIVVMDESGSMGFAQQFSVQFIADLETAFLARGIGATSAGGNRYGLLGYGGGGAIESGHVFLVGGGTAPFGTAAEYGVAAGGLLTNGVTEDGYLAMDLLFKSYTTRVDAAKFVILVTNEDRDIIDPNQTFATTLTRLQAGGFKLEGILSVDIVDQNNTVALALDSLDNAFVDDGAGGYIVSPNGALLPGFDTTIPDYADLVFATGGIVGDIDQISNSQQTATIFSQVLVDSIIGQVGTNSAASGDWRSVLLDTYANDRNVELVLESESTFIGPVDASGTPATAQFLGVLAPNEKSGDADRRLGFEVEGMIALDDPTDLDVYSFQGSTGSEVWIDIDRSSAGLDTIVELIDANGTVLAQSLDNATLSGLAQTMIKETYLGGDFYSINPRDAGMRVILPGQTGNTATYYVRVRSQPTLTQEANLEGGLSRGHYQLQVRLRQRDEVAGSIIKNSDILYATNGIEIRGQNAHSPLVGETGEFGGNNSLGAANPIGNLLQSDRNTISVAGNLSASNDLDWFSFTIDYDLIQAIAGFNGADKTWATMFDIDYADGISRPDTIISVFDDAGNLILVSRDSNIEDDQPGTGQGADTDDLTRGTFGTLDPYIGTVQMPAGVVPTGSTRRYYVAVSSNAQMPAVLNATFQSGANNPLVRLEPVNSVIRIAEDHIGFSGHTTGTAGGITSLVQPVQSLFDISSSVSLSTNVLPLTLSDLTLYVSQGGGTLRLWAVNPGNGDTLYDIGGLGSPNNEFGDIAMRSDGHLYGVQDLGGVANTEGRLVEIDWSNAAPTVIGNDGIPNFDPATNPPDPNQRTGDDIDAMAFVRTGVGQYDLYYSVFGFGAGGSRSALFSINPVTGVHTGFRQLLPGRTRGLAFVGGQMFGVTDAGSFYAVGGGQIANLGIQFAGLAPAPQNLQNGALANMMFAIDTSGRLYCLNTNGVLQSVFEGGSTSVSTGLGSATGLAFSPLDFNLWHPTETRATDPGHGINPSFDESRNLNDQFPVDLNGRGSNEQTGGASFYFGLDNWAQDPDSARSYFPYADNAQYGILTEEAHRDLASNPLLRGFLPQGYNLPGGAHGSLATSQFSLDGYSLADKPTVYFNYFLNTEGRNSRSNTMRDSFRVHISTDGGNSWEPLITNNSELSSATQFMELPRYISTSWNASDHALQRVQEAFDNTGGWRQARVDLSEFVGNSNLQIRFDFSTAGSMDQPGLPGDNFGNYFNRERTLNNSSEGVYIDDVIIGFAERGEMATASNGQTGYFPVPVNPDPSAPTQVLTGAYQLEIRRGTEYGDTTSGVVSDIALSRTFDTNTRFIAPLLMLGDQNLHREQGHIVIDGNTIRQSSGFGIVVDAGTRDGVPHPGTVLNVTTLNNRRLAPGISLENNIIAELGTGGILFSGDPNTAGALAAVYYGRILNNTIYGGAGVRGSGIVVTENANPTILNNIIVNTANAITVDASSSATVVGTTLFLDNANNGVTGSNAILLPPGAPLFVEPLTANFYLMPGSQAIDSSLNTLAEDLALLAVKSPLGIPTAPITAPERDRYNQLRVDDPLQQPPPGLGSNVFKDRGAVERSDFVRPSAFISNPLDNDSAGRDRNSAPNVVNIKNEDLFVFALQLTDSGAGIDDAIVNAGQFVLRMDARLLLQGIDYQFAYDTNTNSVIFLPLAGIWTRNKTYTIVVDNTSTTGVLDRAGNRLEANQGDGTTRFTIFFGTVRDFGDAPDPTYPSLNASNGASHEVVAGYHLGAGVDEENDAKQTSNADGDAIDDGLSSHSLVPGGTRSHIAVVASAEGKLDAWLDLNRDGDWDDAGEYIVSSATPAGQLVAGTNTINLRLPAGSRGASYLRLRFSSAGITSPLGVANDGEVEDYQVQLLGPLFQNPANNLDVTADGFVSPIDALRIINFINRYKDNPFFTGPPNNGNMPLPNPFAPTAPDFLDTNGDGFVSAVDALLVLNFLNSTPPPTGEGEGEGDGMAPASFRSFVSGPVTTVDGMVVGTTVLGNTGQEAVPAVMYANSSVVVEVKNPAPSQSQLDDQLFGSGQSLVGDDFQPVIDELHPASQREQKMEAKSRQRRENEDSWDELLVDLAADIGKYGLEN